ncbi:MAG TPA: hypothetical protein VKS24_20945 [Bradyrhizobium sp.]|nr:hypothetical protein [Bradyrhizobium sp.]
MKDAREFRARKPAFYPDQAVYPAYAGAEFGLGFEDIDGGTRPVFKIASNSEDIHFGLRDLILKFWRRAFSATGLLNV